MSDLTNQDKLDLIIKFSKELGVTSYEFGEHTSISAVGAHNILTGESKNPRTRNLNIMLEYLESKQIRYGEIKEPSSNYNTPSLKDFTPSQIIKHILDNKEEFEKNTTFQLFVENIKSKGDLEQAILIKEKLEKQFNDVVNKIEEQYKQAVNELKK